jgi:D-aminopeptidase
VTTAVKRGVGRMRAVGMHPSAAHESIRADVARALKAKKWPKPLTWRKPLTCRLVVTRSDYADGRDGRTGVKRIDARTIEKKARRQLDILI